jgi:hypothetical protein
MGKSNAITWHCDRCNKSGPGTAFTGPSGWESIAIPGRQRADLCADCMAAFWGWLGTTAEGLSDKHGVDHECG